MTARFPIIPLAILAAFVLGSVTARQWREHELAVLLRATQVDGSAQALFWRDEAMRAYAGEQP